MNGTTVFLTAIAYVSLLFLIAWWGDRGGRRFVSGGSRAFVYALSLAVYCTSWTYYGSVGLASEHGLDFLPIYIGPILVIGLGAPLVGRIARLARAQNVTTVADFVSARYGKSQSVAAVAALIVLVGSAPYIALQLKAVATTLLTVVNSFDQSRLAENTPSTSFYLAISMVLAAFAMAFGTRRINPKEQQNGLILAIAVEFDRQARGVSCRRGIRRLEDERRHRRSHRSRSIDPTDRRGHPDAAEPGGLGGHHAPVGNRDRAAAAPVPRRHCRESRSAGHSHGVLALSSLSRSDQSLRRADRHRGPQNVPGRRDQPRPDRSGAAARRRRSRSGALYHDRRHLRRDRHGCARQPGARDHHLE